MTREEFMEKHPDYYSLSEALLGDAPIEFELYKAIPGITEEKLKALHDKFIAARKK